MPSRNYLSISEFANKLGVAVNTVKDSIKSNRIYLSENGKLEIPLQLENWEKNKDISKLNDKYLIDQPSKSQENIESFGKAKLAKEIWTAKMRQLEYEQATGKLIELESVKIAALKFSKNIRDSLLILPDRISGEVLSKIKTKIKNNIDKEFEKDISDKILKCIDDTEIEKIIHTAWNKETRELLSELSKGLKI